VWERSFADHFELIFSGGKLQDGWGALGPFLSVEENGRAGRVGTDG
jgi:hypothetical protein